MFVLMLIIFVIGYMAIAFEHTIHIDKAAAALLTGVLVWTAMVFGKETIFAGTEAVGEHGVEGLSHFIEHHLMEHLSEIGSILFFLLGAMTIVELIDAHQGFTIITDKIKTTNRVKLIWILAIITFFFSAVLDNLTTSIVMAALLKKLVADKHDLWFIGGLIVIAANAGGAWSPIGDVTTIMLWIGGQITAAKIIAGLFIPSLLAIVVPLVIVSFTNKGNITSPTASEHVFKHAPVPERDKKIVFFMGIGALLFVPIFKTFTHLPPFMGILLGLGALWVTTEILHRNKNDEHFSHLTVVGTLREVDVPSVLFFLGILLAVAGLQTAGHLDILSHGLDKAFSGNIYIINILIGLLSSIVDNVPLVAGAMGMYSMDVFPPDHAFWEFLAYCAGTGGSVLIIGSAAGVAIMGILKIDFMWYLKKISFLALAGYLAGAGTYYLMEHFIL